MIFVRRQVDDLWEVIAPYLGYRLAGLAKLHAIIMAQEWADMWDIDHDCISIEE